MVKVTFVRRHIMLFRGSISCKKVRDTCVFQELWDNQCHHHLVRKRIRMHNVPVNLPGKIFLNLDHKAIVVQAKIDQNLIEVIQEEGQIAKEVTHDGGREGHQDKNGVDQGDHIVGEEVHQEGVIVGVEGLDLTAEMQGELTMTKEVEIGESVIDHGQLMSVQTLIEGE